MPILGDILGLSEIRDRLKRVEERLDSLESFVKPEIEHLEKGEDKILAVLDKAKTTKEVASALGMSRSWTSMVLNLLEKKGRVREKEMRGREILYERV
ncbi:MAG: hypothetical protein L6243_05925 [Candidatus Altiarchaeales archaeon]|nr:hypothetical protein [Candidatus Altiarchaeota archaeon]MBU4406904.1 hypothetical protein [Candidatus Altiarchaeota archaeon]MBU4437188.1 hypothetical protein [Candidatus Altiarchaeota archaeon]MCG2783110.1 hypothetical protein [Candidatus Altiarchaeales archaeon]